MLEELGWDRVRFGDVAVRTGVSRPTLYAAFANKNALAEALVLRETERFLVGMSVVLEAEPAVGPAIESAVAWVLQEAGRSPLLHAVLTSTRNEGLLPLLTTRGSPVQAAATAALTAWVSARLPDLAVQHVHGAVDALVRLVVSHLVLPADDPAGTPRVLAAQALQLLGQPAH